jgi:hypothetical protein
MIKKITLEALLEEAKKEIGKIEVGQVYETLNSIYPDDSVLPSEKNVIINGNKMTLPLASSSKTKKEFRKKGDSFYNFFKEGIKGDYLLVEDISGNDIVCKNISITEGSMKDYYKYPSMKKISITKDDIVKGNVKRVYRGYKGHLEGKK